MPELPEVETIARSIREGSSGSFSILKKTILDTEVLWYRSIAFPDAETFRQKIRDQRIEQVGRRGKYIVVTLSSDTLLIHLRMSGDIRVEEYSKEQPFGELHKHDRVVFALNEQHRLVFNDTRKFGRVWLLEDPLVELGKLGPEPLDGELTEETFYSMLQQRNRQLKPLLMDQTFLAGLGNIYTDEALFKAKLHPLMNAGSLNRAQADLLLKSIRDTLREGIRRNGASIDWVYKGGDFQNYFHVYGRAGEVCLECGAEIQRIVVGQRGTHICPNCQPE